MSVPAMALAADAAAALHRAHGQRRVLDVAFLDLAFLDLAFLDLAFLDLAFLDWALWTILDVAFWTCPSWTWLCRAAT